MPRFFNETTSCVSFLVHPTFGVMIFNLLIINIFISLYTFRTPLFTAIKEYEGANLEVRKHIVHSSYNEGFRKAL